MDKSIEAAALVLQRSFNESTRGALSFEHLARAAIAAYRDAEIADLRAKLEAAERMMQEAATALLPDAMDVTKAYNILCRPIKAARGGER